MRRITIALLLWCVGLGVLGQETEYRITISRVNVRECARVTCPVLFTYPLGTLLAVEGVETGDEIAGNTEWVKITDTLSQLPGYIHSVLTAPHTPEDWQTLPVIPEVSDTAREIYRRGVETGNDPNAFSKVGDCQNVSSFFLAVYDTPEEYALGPYEALQPAIEHFAGSWSRQNITVDNGFNVASVLSPLWADPDWCESDETPLECEYRLHRPSIVLISMETWWAGRAAEEYETYMERIVEFWIDNGVVPVLATKADNFEGDHGINAAIARVAQKYDVPLWNFWLAVQPLPGHGLTTDSFHLTFARNFFDDPDRLTRGWPVRNLTALQAIHAVWLAVSAEEDE